MMKIGLRVKVVGENKVGSFETVHDRDNNTNYVALSNACVTNQVNKNKKSELMLLRRETASV